MDVVSLWKGLSVMQVKNYGAPVIIPLLKQNAKKPCGLHEDTR